MNFQDKVNFIWSIAELLRGDYKQSEYGKIILPLTVIRRLDSVLTSTKQAVLEKLPLITSQNKAPIINKITGQTFHNISKFDFGKLTDDANNISTNLIDYINGFSANAKEIIDYFSFQEQITRLDNANLLYLVVGKFSEIDLHPDTVSNMEMGYVFEELIRRFSEQSNETAGEHFTPREVIKLMVNVLFIEDSDILTKEGIVKTLYDPACGTGGMMSVAQEYLKELNISSDLQVFGQELNPESYAICKSDMMLKGCSPQNIKFGNSFTQDGLTEEKFDYMLSNPPFGVDWKKVEKEIKDEAEKLGYAGRFGAGLPSVSDGSMLFLQHMISKMKERDGSRIGIVFNGSPLFTGDAGSGVSEIRKWIIENDWLEGIIALPNQLFYNTGIATYIWIVSNRKSAKRKGKVQLVNVVDFFVKMRKSLGNKRNEISKQQIDEIVKIYGDFKDGEYCKIFDNEDFGYNKIVVERPLRLNFKVDEDRIKELYNQTAFKHLASSKKKGQAGIDEIEDGKKIQREIINVLKSMDSEVLYKNRDTFTKELKKIFKNSSADLNANVLKILISALSEKDENADICVDSKGNPESDSDLRDTESIPLKEDIYEYFEREVKPHVSDAWIDESKTKIGYEVPFTRHFYKYQPLRSSEVILEEIKELEQSILEKLKNVID